MGEAGNPAQGGGIGEDPMGSAGGRGGRGGGGDAPGPIASTTLVVRWQTALPVKQALVKMKYGSEVTTSPEAKKILDSEEKAYVIAVSGVGPAMMGQGMRGGGDPEAMKKALLEQTSLAVKGKDEVKPTAVQFGRVGRGFEVYFVFQKKDEFSMDDKEIEFVTRLGPVQVKQKFRLKDMVYNGKLAL